MQVAHSGISNLEVAIPIDERTACCHVKLLTYYCGRLPMDVGSLARIGITERRGKYSGLGPWKVYLP